MKFKAGDLVTFHKDASPAFRENIRKMHGNPPFKVTGVDKSMSGGDWVYFKKLREGHEGWRDVNFTPASTIALDEELFNI